MRGGAAGATRSGTPGMTKAERELPVQLSFLTEEKARLEMPRAGQS
jgi:hypothetical protein